MKDDSSKIKVGCIVKKSYNSVRNPTKRERSEYKYDIYLPIAGIVKRIYNAEVEGIEECIVAEIDWFSYEVPELNAISDPWDLDYERRYKNNYRTEVLTLFEPYYKNFLKRHSAQKKKKKESSLQQRKTVVE